MAATKMKKLFCGNEIIESIKPHNLIELKLFYNMLYYYNSNEKYNLDEFEMCDYEVTLTLQDLKKILGSRYSENEIEQTIDVLPREIRLKKAASNKVGFISVYDYVLYDYEEHEMKYKLNNTFLELAEYTLNKFTALELNEFATLRSTYSQRLYELYKQYTGHEEQKGQNNYNMPIAYLYDYFNVDAKNNISEVLRFGIDAAIKELDKKTGAKISYIKTKRGNRITHIHFVFNS